MTYVMYAYSALHAHIWAYPPLHVVLVLCVMYHDSQHDIQDVISDLTSHISWSHDLMTCHDIVISRYWISGVTWHTSCMQCTTCTCPCMGIPTSAYGVLCCVMCHDSISWYVISQIWHLISDLMISQISWYQTSGWSHVMSTSFHTCTCACLQQACTVPIAPYHIPTYGMSCVMSL